MPWTTDNYTGKYAFGPDGILKTGLFELFRAVNERQGLIGITKTQWYKANGAQASDIALSDLTGFKIQSANYKTNLLRLYSAIRAMDDFFLESTTSRTRYTTAALETAIGATLSPDIAGQRIMDASLLQVAQDALDLLTITFLQNGFALAGSGGFEKYSGSYRSGVAQFPLPFGTDLDTAQDAWDARGDYSTGYEMAGWFAFIGRYNNGPPHGDEYDARERLGAQNAEVDFSGHGLSVPVASTWYRIVTNNEWTNDIDYDFAGVSETAPGSSSTDQWFQGTDVALDAPSTFSLSVDAPATPGVAGLASGDNYQVTISISLCEAIFSIAPLLTDQA